MTDTTGAAKAAVGSYDLWLAELDTPTPEDQRLGRPHEAALLSGFWRIGAAKTKPDFPVAIWSGEEGQSFFQIGRKLRNTTDHEAEWDDFAGSTWFHCSAVPESDYHQAVLTGFWPDGKPSRQMSDAEKLGLDVKEGGNNPPIEESLADQISALVEKAKSTPEPTTQDQANAASGILDKLRALLKRAEAERVSEKEPHLQASREVDAKWAMIANPGKDAGVELNNKRKAFLRKEQVRLDAEATAERKRQQALVDAENERIRKENEARSSDPTELLPEVAIPVVETPRATAGSPYGRSTGLKKVKVAVVDDPAQLVAHFIETKDVDFADYLQKRAASALRGKVTLPGCTSKDELQ